MGKTRPLDVTLIAALLAVYVIWGSTYIGIKFAIETMPPLLMAGLRFVIAGSILYALLRLRGAPRPQRAEWRGSAVIGFLLLTCGNALVVLAEQWVATGMASLITSTTPLWVALITGLWGRWPRGMEWVGMALGGAGVALLTLGADLSSQPQGLLLALLSTITWSLGVALSPRMTQPAGLMATAVQMLTGGVLLTVVALALGERFTVMPSTESLLAFGYLILFGSLIGYSAFGYLTRNTRPALATSYAYVNPLVAVSLGIWLGGEQLSQHMLIAIPLILSGVALVVLAKGRAKPAPATTVVAARATGD